MAGIWADGFDHYGGNAAFMAQAGYTLANPDGFAAGRTGPNSVFFFPYNNNKGIRKPMAAANRIVQGVGIYVEALPGAGAAGRANGLRAESGVGVQEYRVVPNSSAGFSVLDRTGAIVGNTPNAIFNLNTWYWLEVQADVNSGGAGTGRIEVRLEGNPQVTINGVNMPNQFQNHTLGHLDGSGFGDRGQMRFDDYVVCDGTTARNNSFLGDRRCETSFMDADTAQADWSLVGGATGFGILDNNPPVDTSYIEALAAGNISEFHHTGIGIASNDIAFVNAMARLMKTDAGTSTVRLGVHSQSFVDNGPAVSPGTSFNYISQIWELDPNGNIPWTRSAVDAAYFRLTRDS